MATAGPRACAEACAGAASPAAASVTSATRIDPLLCLEGEGGLLALDLDEHLVHVAGGQLDVVAVMAVGDPPPHPPPRHCRVLLRPRHAARVGGGCRRPRVPAH